MTISPDSSACVFTRQTSIFLQNTVKKAAYKYFNAKNLDMIYLKFLIPHTGYS
jgi:hypothetical protein